MTSFDAELRGLAERFDLPEPVRSRALLELRSDLEDMAAALEARGLGAEEARRRALEALLPGREAEAEWGRVHRPLYQRLVDRFSARGRHRLERLLLAVVAATYLGGGVLALSGFDLLGSPSPWLWPVLALSGLMVLVGVTKLFQLFVAGAHGRARLHRGLGLLLGLAGATLLVAFAGVAVDLYAVAGRLQGEASSPMAEVLSWLRSEAVLLSVALVSASAGGLVWLAASVRIAAIEQAEAAALGFSQQGGRDD